MGWAQRANAARIAAGGKPTCIRHGSSSRFDRQVQRLVFAAAAREVVRDVLAKSRGEKPAADPEAT